MLYQANVAVYVCPHSFSSKTLVVAGGAVDGLRKHLAPTEEDLFSIVHNKAVYSHFMAPNNGSGAQSLARSMHTSFLQKAVYCHNAASLRLK